MTPKIPILICIDIEPDERTLDPRVRSDWAGFEKSYEFFSELRPRLEMATESPVHFSWFLRMDPQVAHTYGSPDWVVTRYPRLIEGLKAAGDELGLHAHPWRWDEESKDWISDFGDQKWIDYCVRSSFEAFQTSLSRQCRCFRFGDRWMNDHTLDLLEQLGTRFDLTLEPGQSGHALRPDEHFTGSFPDYTSIPQAPYRPDEADFTKPGFERKRRLWLIPVSAGSEECLPRLPSEPDLESRSPNQPHQTVPKNHITLNLAFVQSALAPIMDRLLSILSDPHLVLVARSDVGIKPSYRYNLERNMEHLLLHGLVKDFVFETPPEAIKRLRLDI